MKKVLLLLTCLLTLVSCAQSRPPEDFPLTVELKPKASKTVSSDLTIRFSSVLEDSRCPIGVQCPWEGNAEIMLELSGDGQDLVHLNTGGQLPRSEVFNNYIITLEELKPYPAQGQSLEEKDYTAVLSVDLEKTD